MDKFHEAETQTLPVVVLPFVEMIYYSRRISKRKQKNLRKQGEKKISIAEAMSNVTSKSEVLLAMYHELPTDQNRENDNKSSCGEVKCNPQL